tara:strand:- start:1764 stop:2819 length:1056 start_codon:yes stop_codon:yes gene_type:complete
MSGCAAPPRWQRNVTSIPDLDHDAVRHVAVHLGLQALTLRCCSQSLRLALETLPPGTALAVRVLKDMGYWPIRQSHMKHLWGFRVRAAQGALMNDLNSMRYTTILEAFMRIADKVPLWKLLHNEHPLTSHLQAAGRLHSVCAGYDNGPQDPIADYLTDDEIIRILDVLFRGRIVLMNQRMRCGMWEGYRNPFHVLASFGRLKVLKWLRGFGVMVRPIMPGPPPSLMMFGLLYKRLTSCKNNAYALAKQAMETRLAAAKTTQTKQQVRDRYEPVLEYLSKDLGLSTRPWRTKAEAFDIPYSDDDEQETFSDDEEDDDEEDDDEDEDSESSSNYDEETEVLLAEQYHAEENSP